MARLKWFAETTVEATGATVRNVVKIVTQHGGRPLPGVAGSVLKTISPKLAKEFEKRIAMAGGEWAGTILLNGTGKSIVSRSGQVLRVGLKGVLSAAGGALLLDSLAGTAGAAEIDRTDPLELSAADLGLSEGELAELTRELGPELKPGWCIHDIREVNIHVKVGSYRDYLYGFIPISRVDYSTVTRYVTDTVYTGDDESVQPRTDSYFSDDKGNPTGK